ncbi:MAG: hypothetical protein AAF542_06225 [Pseudomonadota bacterium]
MSHVDWIFIVAGSLGCIVAVVHGVILQKKMVTPILTEMELAESLRRLIPLLLHFSTVFWFLGGIALIATPMYPNEYITLATAFFVGVLFAFGAIGNFWGTHGRHPGWVILAVATALIIYGCSQLVLAT